MRKLAVLCTVCLLAAGCLNRTGSKQRDDDSAFRPENLPTEEELGGYPITNRQAETRGFYVIDRQGIDARQEPHDDSETIVHFDYGDPVRVFVEPGKMYAALYSEPTLCCMPSSGITPDYYAVGGNVYREWRDDERENTVQSWRYELVFVKRSALGEMSQVQLIPEELNEVYEVEEKFASDERTSDERLTVELIDKRVYDSMEMRKVDHFQADTAPKIDGRLTLETEAGEVVFEDNTDDGGYFVYYRYEGAYEMLNRHVVCVQYYDAFGYQFVDRNSGEILDFMGFPHVSPDGKYILCIYPYSDGLEHAGVELYRITDDRKIVRIKDSQYRNWGTADYGRDAFWGSDGCFYCQARHPSVNWSNNPNLQCLRIALSGV